MVLGASSVLRRRGAAPVALEAGPAPRVVTGIHGQSFCRGYTVNARGDARTSAARVCVS